MKKMTMLAISLALAACSREAPTQPVSWYKEHEAERVEMLASCKDNPGERGLSPNCINAQKAQNELDAGRRGYAPLPSLGG